VATIVSLAQQGLILVPRLRLPAQPALLGLTLLRVPLSAFRVMQERHRPRVRWRSLLAPPAPRAPILQEVLHVLNALQGPTLLRVPQSARPVALTPTLAAGLRLARAVLVARTRRVGLVHVGPLLRRQHPLERFVQRGPLAAMAGHHARCAQRVTTTRDWGHCRVASAPRVTIVRMLRH
jgi:hypothetical protein